MEDPDQSLRKNRSNFVPPKNRNTALENYIHSIENFPIDQPIHKHRPNITSREHVAMQSLKRRYIDHNQGGG